MRNGRTTSARRAGFSLFEILIGLTILFILAASLIASVGNMRALTQAGGVDSTLAASAAELLSKVTFDLRRSGFATANGKVYPHTFQNGSAGAGFTLHDHAPAHNSSAAGDPAHGQNQEIVLCLPQFTPVEQAADGTNWPVHDPAAPANIVKIYDVPVIDAAGNVVWSTHDTSFVVNTRADGVNYLERRLDGANPTVLARNVERITFETNADDPVNIPLSAVRVRVWLRERDAKGGLHRYFGETVVSLRN